MQLTFQNIMGYILYYKVAPSFMLHKKKQEKSYFLLLVLSRAYEVSEDVHNIIYKHHIMIGQVFT